MRLPCVAKLFRSVFFKKFGAGYNGADNKQTGHLMAEPRRERPKMDTGNRSDGDGVSKPDPGYSKSAPIDDGGNGHSTSHPKPLTDVFSSSSDFKDVVNTAAFVDKTLFIKDFCTISPNMVIITAPRRFGKSTNMNMLRTFLEIEVDKDAKPICDTEMCVNYKLFQDNSLKIYTEQKQFFKEHCGKYPVIYVDFKRVLGTTCSKVIDQLKFVLHEAFGEHFYLVKQSHDGQWVWKSRELLESRFQVETFLNYSLSERYKKLSEEEVISGLKVLSAILHTHFKEQVVALIDEYDAPIMTAIRDENVPERVIKGMVLLLNGLISEFLKSNVHVKRALLNASVRLAGIISPDANNIKTYRFLDKKLFSKSYGFTPEEVKVLLGKSEFEWLKDQEGKVEQWYNGYSGLNDVKYKMYCSWSVVNFLQESVLNEDAMYESYWCESAYVTTLKRLFARSEVIEVLKVLHEYGEIEINVAKVTVENILNLKKMVNSSLGVITKEQIHFFLQFLSDCGYLNVVAKSQDNATMTLKIPNKELKIGFLKEVYSESVFKEKYRISPDNISAYTEALNSVFESQEESSFVGLANAISNLFSDKANLPENETVFHSILFVMAHNASTLTTRSEVSVKKARKSELGRPPTLDMLVIKGVTGILFELKYNSGSAKGALTQIIEKKYYNIFDESKYELVTKRIYVGSHLAEDRKVTLCYLVDNIDVNAAESVCSLDLDAASNVSVR